MSRRTTIERYWQYVHQQADDECWPWIGQRDAKGYGRFTWKRGEATNLAHRHAYRIAHGPFSATLYVCHRCDNPSCVNPRHLFLGTQADNMADCSAKGRIHKHTRRGRDSNKNRLTETQVRSIRQAPDTNRELSEQYGVSSTAIYLIRKRQNWAWLDD